VTRKTLAKLALVALVVTTLACAKAFGVLGHLSEPARLARTLVELGGWGYVAFVVTYAALQPFGVPGTVFVMAAPLIWPWPVAFARFVARDWIAPRIPARFKRYDDALEHRAFATVFLLRLVFWMPQLLHAFFGVSKVRGWTHFWGSLLGYLLPLFLVSYFGQKLFDVLRKAPPSAWVAAAVVVVLAWYVVWLRRPPSPSA
jgi:uncharacterized membrane protein YdjX (TVP38/TMEM64 family)